MMRTEDTVVRNIENLLANNGMTVSQLINHLGRRNSTVLNLPDEKQKEFRKLYDQIDSDLFDKTEKGRNYRQAPLRRLFYHIPGLRRTIRVR